MPEEREKNVLERERVAEERRLLPKNGNEGRSKMAFTWALFVALFSAILGVSVAIPQTINLMLGNQWLPGGWIVVGVFFALSAAAVLFHIVDFVRRRVQFKEEFEFTPSGIPSFWAREQELVDIKLHQRATDLEVACREQEKINSGGLSNDATDFDKEVARYRREVAASKKAVKEGKVCFWHPHGLAKMRGYLVEDSFKKYLNLYELRDAHRKMAEKI